MDKIVKIDGVTRRDTTPAPDKINIDGVDYINKQSLVSFIEDAIAENLENTTDENHDNHEGYHQACWDIIYRINQMGK